MFDLFKHFSLSILKEQKILNGPFHFLWRAYVCVGKGWKSIGRTWHLLMPLVGEKLENASSFSLVIYLSVASASCKLKALFTEGLGEFLMKAVAESYDEARARARRAPKT